MKDIFRTLTTLSDLQSALETIGIKISLSALYSRLQPRCATSNEGKKHKDALPVKLMSCSNDEHKKHPDSYFAKASINHLEELASLLGPSEVLWISPDDKEN